MFTLAHNFGRLLRKHEGQVRLEHWQAAVQASGIAELIAFVDGLADDAEAVANGWSLTWSNGMVEGFINKVKWINAARMDKQACRCSNAVSCCILLPERQHVAQRKCSPPTSLYDPSVRN